MTTRQDAPRANVTAQDARNDAEGHHHPEAVTVLVPTRDRNAAGIMAPYYADWAYPGLILGKALWVGEPGEVKRGHTEVAVEVLTLEDYVLHGDGRDWGPFKYPGSIETDR
jgi:hypothetical protein